MSIFHTMDSCYTCMKYTHTSKLKMALDWIESRVKYIKALSRPTEEQRLLAALYDERDNLTSMQKRKFDLLTRAERAEEKAAAAKAALKAITRNEKDIARKERNHNLFQSAGLLQLAGLVDKETGKPFDTEMLLGALNHIKSIIDNQQNIQLLNDWKTSGNIKLKSLQEKKKIDVSSAIL